MPSLLQKSVENRPGTIMQYNNPGDVTLVTSIRLDDTGLTEKLILAVCAKRDGYSEIHMVTPPDDTVPPGEVDWHKLFDEDTLMGQVHPDKDLTLRLDGPPGTGQIRYLLHHFVFEPATEPFWVDA